MLVSPLSERRTRTLEFGIYRDGDNNLDQIQAQTIQQAVATSARDGSLEFTIEDTTARGGFAPFHTLRTESYTIADGSLAKRVELEAAHDMASRSNLARFVTRTLDNAERAGAQSTWIDLVDHGAGDGGGLQADHGGHIMREDDIAGAIADGVAAHTKAHPEDAGRRVDGVVANQCLMATLGMESALSHAGVRFLAASPETMLAPGTPSNVAHDIAAHTGDPKAMARAVVARVMHTEYGAGNGDGFGPAAAFDVLDLAPEKIANLESSVRALNSGLTAAAHERALRSIVREDARAVPGMVRFPDGKDLPWRADRPALALYDTLAQDGRLAPELRGLAQHAAASVRDTVLAHRESDGFEPFACADYSDAAGPTVHFPITPGQIDPWAPQISETDNAFYRAVGGGALARAVA